MSRNKHDRQPARICRRCCCRIVAHAKKDCAASCRIAHSLMPGVYIILALEKDIPSVCVRACKWGCSRMACRKKRSCWIIADIRKFAYPENAAPFFSGNCWNLIDPSIMVQSARYFFLPKYDIFVEEILHKSEYSWLGIIKCKILGQILQILNEWKMSNSQHTPSRYVNNMFKALFITRESSLQLATHCIRVVSQR